MSGIQKTITRSGFDLGFWSILDGSFSKSTGRFVVKFVGYKDKATYDSDFSLFFKGGEIIKAIPLASYDGTNFITWLYTQSLLPEMDGEIDRNIFSGGTLIE